MDESLSAFIRRSAHALELERRAEIAESERLQGSLTPAELELRGVALLNLTVSGLFAGIGGRSFAKLVRTTGDPLPAHQLGPGDVVQLRPSSGEDEPLTGVVSRVRRDAITVALDRTLERELTGKLRLDRVANDVTYRRLREALERLERDERGRARRVRECCFGLRDPEPPEEGDLARARAEVESSPLDPSQKEAVGFALAADPLALIHGPPGTGKTTAVAELIRGAVRRGERVLACAPSNVAVDNLVEKLAALRVVRIGHPARLLPTVLEHSLDALVERAAPSQVIAPMQKELDSTLRQLRRARDRSSRRQLRGEVRALRQEMREIEERTVRDILESAEVILTTNTGAADPRLEGLEFDRVVIDEAAQALECSSWIPALRGERLVLAGDHLQLPPTIISVEAEKEGLGVTLFERLAGEHPELCRLLTVQYRMHETIMRWSSEALYEGSIEAHPSVESHRLVDLPDVVETPDTATPFLFVDTAGYDAAESVDEHGESRWNDGEAALVARHVKNLLDAGVPGSAIGVITPYNAQVHHLRRLLSPVNDELEIDSVDGFQGREKEAVILSLVRSNERGEVGFLADHRRLNVAITRARRHVAVFGDSATISRNPFLERLVAYMSEHALYRSAYEVDLDG